VSICFAAVSPLAADRASELNAQLTPETQNPIEKPMMIAARRR